MKLGKIFKQFDKCILEEKAFANFL